MKSALLMGWEPKDEPEAPEMWLPEPSDVKWMGWSANDGVALVGVLEAPPVSLPFTEFGFKLAA